MSDSDSNMRKYESRLDKIEEKQFRRNRLRPRTRNEKTVDCSVQSAESPSLETIVNWPQSHPFMSHLTSVRVDGLRKEVDTLKTEVERLKKELTETRETSQKVFNLFNFLTKNMYPDVDYYSDELSDDQVQLTVSHLETSDADADEDDEEEQENESNDSDNEEIPEPPKLTRQSNASFQNNIEYTEVPRYTRNLYVSKEMQSINPLNLDDLMSDPIPKYVGEDGIDYWDYGNDSSNVAEEDSQK